MCALREVRSVDPDKPIGVTFKSVGDEVHFSVRDKGPGLTDMDKQKVFGKFQQLSSVPTGEESSTGLGLSIVKQIVELHGGRVWVESEAGQGATFTVALKTTLEEIPPGAALPNVRWPDAMAPAEPASKKQPGASQALPQVHSDDTPLVLLVEDHDPARKHVSDILQEHYRVTQARNGWEGLEKIRMLQPDLVISDVVMPIMDGRALCEEVKKDPTLNHIPVILMTAWATPESKTEGLEAGADDFIAKPFHARALLTRTQNLIRLRQQEKEVKTLNHKLQILHEEMENKVQEKLQTLLAEREQHEQERIVERDEALARQSRTRSSRSNWDGKPTAP